MQVDTASDLHGCIEKYIRFLVGPMVHGRGQGSLSEISCKPVMPRRP